MPFQGAPDAAQTTTTHGTPVHQVDAEGRWLESKTTDCGKDSAGLYFI